jgi:hypothetical protein
MNITFERLAELAKAESEGRIVIMPYPPGTVFQQDKKREYDVVFTGNVLYETKSNEDTEWIDDDEARGLEKDCAESLEKDGAE